MLPPRLGALEARAVEPAFAGLRRGKRRNFRIENPKSEIENAMAVREGLSQSYSALGPAELEGRIQHPTLNIHRPTFNETGEGGITRPASAAIMLPLIDVASTPWRFGGKCSRTRLRGTTTRQVAKFYNRKSKIGNRKCNGGEGGITRLASASESVLAYRFPSRALPGTVREGFEPSVPFWGTAL